MKPSLFALLVLLSSSPAFAQELPKFDPPTKEHEILKNLVGEWETAAESIAAPGQPAMKCTGKIIARMLGGFWVIAEAEADMMGMKYKAVQTIGYDPKAKKYVGTWVDSMMNHMWKYEGSVDETGKILTLEAEGPNFVAGEGTAKYRDVYEFKSKDEMVTTSLMQGEDGKWTTFMSGTAKRKK